MAAGKVKLGMGLQKSSATKAKPDPSPKSQVSSPSSAKVSQKGGGGAAVFSRSFGVYFPRASAQVQPRPPPDVTELLHLVEELRERESRLKTEILEQKLLKESVAILPVLENEMASREMEIERAKKKIECLEAENERLRQEVEMLHESLSNQKKDYDQKLVSMQSEILDLRKKTLNNEKMSSAELSSSQRFQGLIDVSGKSNLIKNLKRSTTTIKEAPWSNTEGNNNYKNNEAYLKKEEVIAGVEPERRRHSRSNSDEIADASEAVVLSSMNIVKSRVPRVPKPPPRPSSSSSSFSSSSASSSSALSSCMSSPCYSALSESADRALADLQPANLAPPPRPPPPPPPPPLPSSKAAPPPPPPPPPRKGFKPVPAKVRRVPEVVEFYHSLMRRDSRRESGGAAAEAPVPAANARDMIGEIENRSAHLLAIKTDVETQGDFIRFLIKEVESAAFTDVEDVVPFVKWLDDELSFLVDERAVLKHFDWPEQKADALREAAFGYCDLKKLESEASLFRDNLRQPCAPALKKMQALFEKLEHGVYSLSRMRESAAMRYKVFQIPMDWMLDTGLSQIKLASVKLAMKYMRRVSAELEMVGGGPEEEELIVQGVRFAFRVHQFAGGFDVETMKAFQELRDKARSCHIQCHSQQQQKYLCRSTTC